MPLAPGTAMSAVTVYLIWLLPTTFPLLYYVLGVIVLLGLGLVLSPEAAAYYGKRDPSHVVIDEIVGMAIALIAVPRVKSWYVIAFVLFRFFDISKIGPVGHAEQLKGGLGIMLDDVIAGVFAAIFVSILLFLMPYANWLIFGLHP